MKLENVSREDQLQIVQKELRETYITSFQKTNPFSLPFTFNIEKSWVSLALRQRGESKNVTEDHGKLLDKIFREQREKMLIIEGRPATGKTSLLRRIAFDWASGKEHLLQHHLVLYMEFRNVRTVTFKTLAELAVGGLGAQFGNQEAFRSLANLLNQADFTAHHTILLLLDGYDEASLDKQCEELDAVMSGRVTMNFDIVISSRPGYLSIHDVQKGRFAFADVLGFETDQQKQTFLAQFFKNEPAKISKVHECLESSTALNEIAQIPLYMTFICIAASSGATESLRSVMSLFSFIVKWLIDRYQRDHPDVNVPALLGYCEESGKKQEIIEHHYREFPQLHLLGEIAIRHLTKSVLQEADLKEHHLTDIIVRIGLLRKDEIRSTDTSKRVELFSFPHRTMQEFFASFAYFFSQKQPVELVGKEMYENIFHANWSTPPNVMNETEKFLWRMILTGIPAPIKQKAFYDNYSSLIISLNLFEDISILNKCLLHCVNVEKLSLFSNRGESFEFDSAIDMSHMKKLKEIYVRNQEMDVRSREVYYNRFPDKNCFITASPFLLPPKQSVSLHIDWTHFISAEIFIDSMKHLNAVMNEMSTLQLTSVAVKSANDSGSFLMVKTKPELFSEMNCIQTGPIVFGDVHLNEALRYLTAAAVLWLTERDAKIESMSFTAFEKLTSLYLYSLDMSALQVFEIRHLQSLEALTFVECNVPFEIWNSISDEIALSTVRRLQFPLDCKETWFSNYVEKLNNCDNITSLTFECYNMDISEETAIIDVKTEALINSISKAGPKHVKEICILIMNGCLAKINHEFGKSVSDAMAKAKPGCQGMIRLGT